ncbi:MAG: MFS family permease [Flavobacteriales bacterium]
MNTDKPTATTSRNPWAILVLIIAGETIFLLPFLIPRIIRPTLLKVLDITNLELGGFFSVYGIVAIVAYLFGGPLADKFPAPKLMSTALATTAIGGFFLVTIPSTSGMHMLYGFWGLTTILLFWAAMMKATRLWGGQTMQGRAFGLLDGGRGLVAALIGTIAVYVLSQVMPDGSEGISQAQRSEAFKTVIIFVSGWVLVVALIVRFALPADTGSTSSEKTSITWAKILEVMRLPQVWFQAFLILCAYSAYKVTDDFSLLANEMLGYDEVKAAAVSSATMWIRPVAAIGAGVFADKIGPSRMITFCFLLMLIGGLSIGTGMADAAIPAFVFVALGSTAMGAYAMRGLYFAIMGEASIPVAVTGTAVGFASVIGYLPDVYMGPLMGTLLDSSPGAEGHRHVFLAMSCFAGLGLVVSALFRSFLR